ncbi:Lipase (class 3) [Caulifigura coniformis]|uniref:Lipase (Class 3) n=1 Tax=Caulifigura coniformis TaxID=2527983 RepID=A0A517SD26_9PLAN|nr:lipase family protein [Caulifigura coniformis]QDT54016.1 Lipase (class 3) [Caulifigura coniformis]
MPLTLDVSATTKTKGNAAWFATACDLAYLPETEGVPKFRELLNVDAKLVSVDNTQCYVCTSPTAIVCAFRGSECPNSLDGFKDWLLTNARNFLVLPEGRAGTDFAAAGVGARFHRGFIEALGEIWDPFFKAVDAEFSKQERPVFVTGHSLGGGLAVLAAWRLQRQMIPVQQVYTFGAPMTGNTAAAEAFAKEFPNRIYRFVDYRDMVPKLPTVSLLSNEYGHCLTEVLLGDDAAADGAQGTLGSIASRTTDQVLSLTIMDEIWNHLQSGISAHLMGSYLKEIDSQA